MVSKRLVRTALALAGVWVAFGQTRQVEIDDLILKMRAYSIAIPGKWIFEGRVMQGTSCAAEPFAVFRMVSPDGFSEVKLLPRFDWTWGVPPKSPTPESIECLPLEKELSAAEFLKYMVPVLGVTFVRELPAEKAGQARFLVRYRINGIPVDEDLQSTVACKDTKSAPLHTCSATVMRIRTREGQLDALQGTAGPIAQSFAVDPVWKQKWSMPAATGTDSDRSLRARHDSALQGEALRRRQHDQFLASMRHGIAAPGNSVDAQSRRPDDWADYALDQQKRLDPATGQLTNNYAASSYTWVNAAGQHYETNDRNDNPNGRLKGNWTLQPSIH